VKQFPQKFTLADNQKVLLEFEKLLLQHGLRIPVGSPLEKASLGIIEILETYKNKSIHNLQIDCRENWRQALSLADIVRKILRASNHSDFQFLMPHIKLLLEPANLSQFSFSPKEDETNNKIFELFTAVILFQIFSNLKFDHPKLSKKSSEGKNPDVIGEFKGKKWAFACKSSHSPNPQTFLERVRDGIEQIERANVDRGIIFVNLKNLIPHDDIWQAKRDAQTGVWEYAAYLNRDAPITLIRQMFQNFEQNIFSLIGGRQAFVNEFTGTKVVPMVLMFYCTVAGISYAPGIRGPIIIKQLTGTGIIRENLDSEAEELIDLFNDYLHDREE
jgi:hypothetical protein